jgi:hypothetical protein
MNLIQRFTAPTPRFYKKVRKAGMLLTAISGAFLTAPAELPQLLTTIATYLGIAGSLATIISQAATEEEGFYKKNGKAVQSS